MSGRIRTIKPEVLEDELMADLDDSAWRLYVSSWVMADDHGRFRAGARYLAAEVWKDTRKENRAESALQELRAKKFLRTYQVEEQRYAEIKPRAWRTHQRIDHPGKPRVPVPTDSQYLDAVSRSVSDDSPRVSDCLGEPRPSRTRARPPTSDLRPPTSDLENTSADADPSSPAESPQNLTLVPVEPSRDDAREVWEWYLAGWRQRIRGTRPPVFTPERRRLAKARLGTFGLDDLKLAIDGLWASDWHLENGHTSFELALRDAKHIEHFMTKGVRKFVGTSDTPPAPQERNGAAPPEPIDDGDENGNAALTAEQCAERRRELDAKEAKRKAMRAERAKVAADLDRGLRSIGEKP